MTPEILEQNKAKNVAALNASMWRMGVGRPLPRSQTERAQLINGTGENPSVFAAGDEIPENPDDSVSDADISSAEPEIKDMVSNWEGCTAMIESWTSFKFESSFSTTEILRDCLGIEEPSKAEQMKLSDVMRGLGYQKNRSTSGKRGYYWSRAV